MWFADATTTNVRASWKNTVTRARCGGIEGIQRASNAVLRRAHPSEHAAAPNNDASDHCGMDQKGQIPLLRCLRLWPSGKNHNSMATTFVTGHRHTPLFSSWIPMLHMVPPAGGTGRICLGNVVEESWCSLGEVVKSGCSLHSCATSARKALNTSESKARDIGSVETQRQRKCIVRKMWCHRVLQGLFTHLQDSGQ